MPRPGAEFLGSLPASARILALDLGFLGDTVHLIPALHAIRRARPRARLEAMVAEHVQSILAVCPWIDGVRGYPRFPAGPSWFQDLARVRSLRGEKFDAVINLNGSDRSSLLTWATGAPLRLGRVPPKVPWFWPLCFTHTVNVPHFTQPVFQQRLDALAAAGFSPPDPGDLFPIEIPQAASRRVDALLGDSRAFVHVSPFATQDEKELPPEVLAEFLDAAQAAHPELAWVLSAAPNEREKAKLAALRARLRVSPWKIFAGDLNLVELAALLRRARLHLGGDSGALHVALMAGTPTLSWWRDYPGRVEWQPAGPPHRAVLGQASPQGLTDISRAQLLAALADALR
jgi:ADP-heptose:LPS heptosyltransferase